MNRWKLWEEGRVGDLIADHEMEYRCRGTSQRRDDDKSKFRAFNTRVLNGYLRSACRALTERDGRGVLNPNDDCTKTGLPFMDVLKSKHPALRDPAVEETPGGAFEIYDDLPTRFRLSSRLMLWKTLQPVFQVRLDLVGQTAWHLNLGCSASASSPASYAWKEHASSHGWRLPTPCGHLIVL